MPLKFSIVSPSFNQRAFVEQTLDSIAQQRHRNREHIIFDGGSTDGTLEVLRGYAQHGAGVTLEIGKDTGQANAINLGFARATGDVLAWLNTDDAYVDADVLSDVAAVFESKPDVDVVYGRGQFVAPDGRLLRDAYINTEAELLRWRFIHSVGILQPALFMRRSVFERFGPLDESLQCAFDYEYWVRIADGGVRFHFLDRFLARAIFHESAKTSALRHRQLTESVDVVRKYYGFAPYEWIDRLVAQETQNADGILKRGSAGSLWPAHRRKVLARFRDLNDSRASVRALLSLQRRADVQKSLSAASDSGLCRVDRLVVTTFDEQYFAQGLTLIAGVHALSGAAHPIVVFDLGLSTPQRTVLESLENVFVVDYPAAFKKFYPEYLSPKSYAYKCGAMWWVPQAFPSARLVLWIDAGVRPQQSLQPLFELLEREEVFFVDHDDKPNWPFYNVSFTHEAAAAAMAATAKELLAPHLCSCLMGFCVGGRFQALFDDAYRYSQQSATIVWSKHPPREETIQPDWRARGGSTRRALRRTWLSRSDARYSTLAATFGFFGHRQDQSIFSILAARFGARISSATRYCYADDQSSLASKLNWQSGGASGEVRSTMLGTRKSGRGAMTLHHRGTLIGYDGLQFAGPRKEAVIVMGNGPSLKGFDFARLGRFDVIGMNAAYRFWDEIGWYPTHFACLDKVLGLSHKDAIRRLIGNARKYGIRMFLLRENLIRELGDVRAEVPVLDFDALRQGYRLFRAMPVTTGSHATLWAAALGYKHIYLMGVDCNYVEQIGGVERKEGTVLQVADEIAHNPNYFFDGYQRKGDRYNVPNPEPALHLNSWRAAGTVLDAEGIAVVNANLQSKVDAFDFCEFDDIEFADSPKVRPVEQVLGTPKARIAIPEPPKPSYARRLLGGRLGVLRAMFARDSLPLDGFEFVEELCAGDVEFADGTYRISGHAGQSHVALVFRHRVRRGESIRACLKVRVDRPCRLVLSLLRHGSEPCEGRKREFDLGMGEAELQVRSRFWSEHAAIRLQIGLKGEAPSAAIAVLDTQFSASRRLFE